MIVRFFSICILVISVTAGADEICPVTQGSAHTLGPPFPESDHWYGSEVLAVNLPADGKWGITGPTARIAVKLFVSSLGYKIGDERHLNVSIENLHDGENDANVKDITNACRTDDWDDCTMLAGIDFPSEGCWQVTLDYLGQSLSFVVETVKPEKSSYVGQERRAIKSLSENDVAAYLRGDGMGFAKSAELNSYPGPRHVLELAQPLGLNEEQKASTQEIYNAMHKDARKLGEKLVAAEAKLDEAFATKKIDSTSLQIMLSEIAGLNAQLRNVHLQAHLQQAQVLTVSQVDRYVRLRGYHTADHNDHMHAPEGTQQ